MAEHKRYHHGDLRHALVAAGLQVLEERGLEGVTLRETARRSGVSHAAPYHHFADKAHLIEALAVESFERFATALRRAWDTTPGPSIARFQAVGLAYVRYALEHPEEFRLMNRPELRQGAIDAEREPSQTPVQVAALASYEVLLHSIRAGQADGFLAAGDPEPLALTAWSSVHGLSVLLLDGLMKRHAAGGDAGMELAEIVTRRLGSGLMAR